MPRMNRVAIGDTIYHVINRANGRVPIFKTDKDYEHFESLLLEAVPPDARTAAAVLTMTPEDVLHAVCELQLPFLQGDFFELFGFGKVMLGGEFVEPTFEFVMLGSELVELLVGLQQQLFQVL